MQKLQVSRILVWCEFYSFVLRFISFMKPQHVDNMRAAAMIFIDAFIASTWMFKQQGVPKWID